jgi:hypothetical protein
MTMINSLETFCGAGLALMVGLLLFGAFAATITGNPVPSSSDRRRQIVQQEKRRTYTTEENELPGVDIRNPNAPRQIEVSRWAVENKRTPGWAEYYQEQQMKANRRAGLFADPDEIVDGDVRDVPQIEAPKRKRLRG